MIKFSNFDNKVITAKMIDCRIEAQDFLMHNLRDFTPQLSDGMTCESSIFCFVNDIVYKYIKREYKSAAICHENDEFDEEIGKKLARKRVLQAYYRDLREASHALGILTKQALINFIYAEDEINQRLETISKW